MLPPEIEPFADHHIAELTKILDLIHPEKVGGRVVEPLDDEAIYAIVRDARSALVRFKVCMVDECAQKDRLRKKALDCRLNHRDK